jgi:hypothetical protein
MRHFAFGVARIAFHDAKSPPQAAVCACAATIDAFAYKLQTPRFKPSLAAIGSSLTHQKAPATLEVHRALLQPPRYVMGVLRKRELASAIRSHEGIFFYCRLYAIRPVIEVSDCFRKVLVSAENRSVNISEAPHQHLGA